MYIYIWNINEHLKIKRPPVDIFVRFSGRATYHPWGGWGCPRWTPGTVVVFPWPVRVVITSLRETGFLVGNHQGTYSFRGVVFQKVHMHIPIATF